MDLSRGFFQPLAVVLAGCLLALPVGGCKQAAESAPALAPPAAPIAVQVVAVSAGQAEGQNEAVGTVAAAHRAVIAAKVTGSIVEMPVKLGDQVKAGDLLVKISAAEIAARLAQAETAVGQARRNLEREQRLLAKGASTTETVKNQQDALQLAEAANSEARVMLGYATIRAPFAGVVSSKPASAGDLATVGAPLLTLENTDHLQAVVSVPEAQVLAIKSGAALELQVPAAQLDVTGKVAEIAPAADAASRTATVKLDLPANASLRPGQFVRVLLPGAVRRTMTVPAAAVSYFGQMERLFVVDNNTAHLRLIRVGQGHDGQIEVLSGVNPGDQVVVKTDSPLTDGHPVKVAP